MMYNAAEQAEEFAINVWHKFQSWKVVGFANLPQWLQVNSHMRVRVCVYVKVKNVAF